jgi:hypothetical protein
MSEKINVEPFLAQSQKGTVQYSLKDQFYKLRWQTSGISAFNQDKRSDDGAQIGLIVQMCEQLKLYISEHY